MGTTRNANSTITSRLAAIGGGAVFGYLTIFLLQWKVIWGIWQWRDLTSGDTGGYFLSAHTWYSIGRGPIAWSPLYTWFYGMLLHVSRDAFVVTTLHRVIIVFALALLVLALMRRLLPPAYAWLAAAWWVVLPIDFNSLYEVHLFAVIPLLLATLAVLWIPGRWGRGWCFAILLIEAALVRNEFLLAALLFGAGCLVYEIRRTANDEPHASVRIRAYGIPLGAACLLIGVFFLRMTPESVSAAFAHKHTVNVCQVYAFGYQQRHSDWQKSPWLDCRELMLRNFGVSRLSLLEAVRRNPRAMLEHFLWNLRLTPGGLQVLMMSMMSGNADPDYVPVTMTRLALPASLLIVIVVLCGAFFVYRDWNYWWSALFRRRAWAWFAMACIACVVPVIILTQRPRPSYLLAFGIFLRAVIAVCAVALLRSRVVRRGPPSMRSLERMRSLGPIVVIVLIVITPSYYPFRHLPRPLLQRYRTLMPFRQWLQAPDTGFATASWAGELCNYVAPGATCRPVGSAGLGGQVTPEKSLNEVLRENRISVLFADDAMLDDRQIQGFLAEAEADGWHLIASSHDPEWRWALWAKPENVSAASVER